MRLRMRIEKLYKYSELSEKAKEKVREMYLDGQTPEFFSDDCRDWLKYDFPNSELDVRYSLGYCQGDFFSITGKLALEDVWVLINRSEFSKKEIKFMNWIFSTDLINPLYCISTYWHSDISNYVDLFEDIRWNVLNSIYKNIRWDTLEKFTKSVSEYMKERERKFMEYGYDYFYEIEETELADWCESNGFEFFENGSVA